MRAGMLSRQDRKPLFQVPDLYELTKGHLKDIPEIEDIKDEKAMQVISALVLKAGFVCLPAPS